MTCTLNQTGGSIPVEVLFAGLAPGTVGYYQVSLRLPSKSPVYDSGLDCRLGSPNGRGYVVIESATIPMQR